jgi:hypothetical protein
MCGFSQVENHEFLTSLQLASSVFPEVIGLHAVAGYPVFPEIHVLASVHDIPAVVSLASMHAGVGFLVFSNVSAVKASIPALAGETSLLLLASMLLLVSVLMLLLMLVSLLNIHV